MIPGLTHSPVTTGEHREFLFRAVRERAGHFPYPGHSPGQLEYVVRREVVQGATAKIIHPAESPDNYVGCFVVRPGAVIFAYTKEPFQKQGIMTSALEDMGFTFAGVPVPVMVWSAAASRIAAGGYRIYPMIPGER